MRGKALGVTLLLLGGVGCGSSSGGGSDCDKVVKGYNDYASKASACGVNFPIGSMTTAQCDQAFSSSGCTAADKTLYGNFGTCLSNLPTCNSSNTQPFLDAVVACTDKLNGLSSGCQ